MQANHTHIEIEQIQNDWPMNVHLNERAFDNFDSMYSICFYLWINRVTKGRSDWKSLQGSHEWLLICVSLPSPSMAFFETRWLWGTCFLSPVSLHHVAHCTDPLLIFQRDEPAAQFVLVAKSCFTCCDWMETMCCQPSVLFPGLV